LENEEKELVFVTHDECVFYAHDAQGGLWLKDGEQILRKKGQGKSLMISGFMCPCHGVVSLKSLEIGKNSEGYWTSAHMVNHLKEAITAFQSIHPGSQGLFMFDQSSNHAALAEDALRASTMNSGSGGKQPKMRAGWFMKDGQKIVQQMQDETGIPKGAKAVLIERGLWNDGLRLESARKLLNEQADFQEQKSLLETTVENAGHLADFHPKYHCETNFIERVWGEAKRWARKHCLFNFQKMKTQVVDILNEIDVTHIRRYHRRAWRYIFAYEQGLSGPLAEWAVQKYRGHRKVSARIDQLMEEWKGSR